MKLFFLKNKIKVKVYQYPKGVPYPNTNPASQGLAPRNKQGKATMRMIWTKTKIKVPINEIAKITWAAYFGDLNK